MDYNLLWSNFLEVLRSKVNAVSYDAWFKETKLIKHDNNTLVIEVPMALHQKFLNDAYYDLIDEIITEITGTSYDFEFNIKDDNEEKTDIENINKNYKDLNSNLNSKYTFENYIVGDSNRHAHNAALAVAEQPGKLYNPLFIHGKSGLGKTHLMHAIGNYIVINSNKTVLYVTSDEFISDFINITNKNDNNLENIQHFKDKYRNIDVLIIDDIQFFGGADKTQQEFFYTFNSLYDSNKQIIISSDRSPDDLKFLEERLKTRFRWGLTIDIYPPNLELKCKIIKNKIKHLNAIKIVDNDVINYIAANCDNDIRDLERFINRILFYSALMGNSEITLEFATEALKEYIGKPIYSINDINKIQNVVADHYNITIEDLKSKKRMAYINIPRQVAMYLCRMTTEETVVKIGLEFGNRDHSTVIHSCEKISNELKENKTFKEEIEEIKNKIVN